MSNKHQFPIMLPEVIRDATSIVFGQWLVDDSDEVLEGDRVAEVLTCGVLVYVVSPAEGTLFRRELPSGATLTIDMVLGTIATNAGETPLG